jgi:hypothetical protein
MNLFRNFLMRFQAPPVPVNTSPYADAEFLEVVMQQARERTRAEEAARKMATSKTPPNQLPAAA